MVLAIRDACLFFDKVFVLLRFIIGDFFEGGGLIVQLSELKVP